MPTQKFRIAGLKHEDEERIAARVRRLNGVFFAVVNHEDECAEVDFEDDMVTCAEIAEAIAELGYAVHVAG